MKKIKDEYLLTSEEWLVLRTLLHIHLSDKKMYDSLMNKIFWLTK